MPTKFQIIRTARGVSQVVAEGSRTKMQSRLKQLRDSTCGGRVSGRGGKKYAVTYELRECLGPGGVA